MTTPTQPTGYIRHQQAIDDAMSSGVFAAAGTVGGVAGAAKRSGKSYFNLTAIVAKYLKTCPQIAGGRNVIDLGSEGVILQPLGQQTGICTGCAHGEAAFQAWVAKYALEGTGPTPQRVSFAWAYLAGRDSRYVSRGDSGAVPSLTVRAYHDVGVLPMSGDLLKLVPHGRSSEESICIQYRDNPTAFLLAHKDDCYPCRVYSPGDAWEIADCLTTTRPVTFGCGWQCNESTGGDGVSSLYDLNGGHETFTSGYFTLGGRLGFIKTESWWNASGFPGSHWPNRRVQIHTDDGPRVLFPGQSAVFADEWMSCDPECWAIDAPTWRAA